MWAEFFRLLNSWWIILTREFVIYKQKNYWNCYAYKLNNRTRYVTIWPNYSIQHFSNLKTPSFIIMKINFILSIFLLNFNYNINNLSSLYWFTDWMNQVLIINNLIKKFECKLFLHIKIWFAKSINIKHDEEISVYSNC